MLLKQIFHIDRRFKTASTISKYSVLKKPSLTLSNGCKLPLIGFGTSMGFNQEEAKVEDVIDMALEAGYRHFDTARMYRNEKLIGRVLQKWFCNGRLKRGEVFITTKLPVTAMRPEKVEPWLKDSLANLQLDYVDLYLIHVPVGVKNKEGDVFLTDEQGDPILEGPTDHVGMWKAMEKQVAMDRARYIGLSNYNISQIETVLRSARIAPACLQVEVHVRLQQRPLVDFCRRNGIAVIGFSPLGAPDYNERMSTFVNTFKKQELPSVLNDDVVVGVARKYARSPAQIVLRFLVQLGVIPIPKSTNRGRMRDNLEICDFELEEEDVATLRKLDVGEEARVTTLVTVVKGIENHPDYPWKK